MRSFEHFYIGGRWAAPADSDTIEVRSASTEEVIGHVPLAVEEDVDAAVRAARGAFDGEWSRTTAAQRAEWLRKLAAALEQRVPDIAKTIGQEVGMPITIGTIVQAQLPVTIARSFADLAANGLEEERIGNSVIVREPFGVAGMITPWNYPLHQIVAKVAPAIAAGCTMILKPSEFTPTSALIFAEVMDAAGVPKGVFNLVNGLGPEVGVAMSEHEGIDMISFTGSTRAGIDVAKRAANTVKRVSQELGGKSPNVILEDADLVKAVSGGVASVFNNSGQSCNAPTRMIVPAAKMKEAAAIAKTVADKTKAGDPKAEGTTIGPVVNRTQWDKIQALIKKGVDEGATLVAGGPGLPEGVNKGFYVRPTVFADVTNDMTIAREEIFGPVIAILGAKDEAEAIKIANDTPYGLAGYVSAGSVESAKRVARQIRAGNVNLNGVPNERAAPFGGYKQSGNGREWGKYGMEDFLEVKAIAGA